MSESDFGFAGPPVCTGFFCEVSPLAGQTSTLRGENIDRRSRNPEISRIPVTNPNMCLNLNKALLRFAALFVCS